MNNLKKTIITIGTITALGTGGVGVEHALTLNNINNFRADLEVLGVQEEQAQNLAEYFKGNILAGKRDKITIQEMQAINRLYGEAIEEFDGEFKKIKNTKDFLKQANNLVEKLADKRKGK